MPLESGTHPSQHEILSALDVSILGVVYRALVVTAFLSLAGIASGEPAWGLEMVWKRPLGPGNSRIVIIEGLAVTLFSDGEFDNAVALDASTGKEIWRYRIAPTYRGHDGSRGGPHASPVVDEGTVYSLGPRGHLFAIDLDDGAVIWLRNIVSDLGARAPFWGFATTPLVAGRILIVQTGAPGGRSICGFDKRTGELVWTAGSDPVGYQSPALMTLAGRRQAVAVTNRQIMGMVPETGEILWTYRHSTTELEGSSEAVSIGNDRFLLTSSGADYTSDTSLYQVVRAGSGFSVEQLWLSSALKYSYAAPVLVDKCLYGFHRSFLTCVDPLTGKRIWRSRPPGGKNFALVEDRLAILTADGRVVTVLPSGEGYEELASLQVLDRGAFTVPTFSEDTIFVRNHAEIAAIRMGKPEPVGVAGDEAQLEEPDADWRRSSFGAFVRRVEVAENKERLIDAFMRSQRRYPIVEGDDLVHFIYRGSASDVAVRMSDWGDADPMRRITGTDFFHRSLRLEPDSRWEYMFEVDLETWITDPLNPRTAPGEWADRSELVMPGWSAPEHLRNPVGERGRVDSFEFLSESLGNRRDVKVYLPAGYSQTNERYALLIVEDGLQSLEYALIDRSLDNLIGESVAALIVAFVGRPEETYRVVTESHAYQEYGGLRTAEHARMLGEELVPYLDQHYRTLPKPDSRALMGNRSAGLAALYAAVHHPDVFSKVAVQSLLFGPTPLQSSRLRRREVFETVLATLNSGPEMPLQFYVDWASHGFRFAEEEIDVRRDSLELVELLRGKGYEVTGGEYPGTDGWGSWRARTDAILEALFPLGSGDGGRSAAPTSEAGSQPNASR